MTRINTNVSSLVAQNRLQSSNVDLQKSLTRLSTGLRINSGSDDPAGLLASESLRSEITGLTKAISNTNRTSQIISTADSALGQVSNLLNDIRGLVNEAGSTGGLSDEEVAANQLQIDSSLEAINRIAQTTTFQGRKLLDGSQDFVTDIGAVDSVTDVSISQAKLGRAEKLDVSVDIESAAEQASVTIDDAAFGAVDSAATEAKFDFNTYTFEANGSQLVIAGDFSSVEVIDDPGLDGSATATVTDGKLTLTFDSGESIFERDLSQLRSAIDGDTDLGARVIGSSSVAAVDLAETPTTGTTQAQFNVARSDGGSLNIVYQESGTTTSTASYDEATETLTVGVGSDQVSGDLLSLEATIEGLSVPGNPFTFEVDILDGNGDPAGTDISYAYVPAEQLNQDVTNFTAALKDDLVFQLNGATGSETFNFGAGTTPEQIAAAVNLVSDATGVVASTEGGLQFTSSDYGSDALINIEVIDEGDDGSFASNLSATRVTGKDIQARVNGVQASGKGNEFSISTSSVSLSLAVDAGSTTDFEFSISGGGASFQLGPGVNSQQQARLGIGSVSTGKLGGVSGRLYELGSGQANSLSADISGAAKIIDEVIGKVSDARGRLGSFQSTTLASNLVSLNETKANLQEAESTIRDADFAQESANLTRAQILVQSGTNVLSLANQNPQNVLSLLR
ncbi:flagellin [Rhodopirellula sp. SWK7]|uniref:flagellin N-terminal helical domain-containing protein n=1 Tax=Rhodopirellula sp. SWK7 TaxID=595460 RepID=UPI0002BFB0CB|nr:flagellin [Rhodopirellula sp. SWK7]EMI44377.1 flagellin [Rhodopirellula sp. SWK7]